jgi:hypothetical protein
MLLTKFHIIWPSGFRGKAVYGCHRQFFFVKIGRFLKIFFSEIALPKWTDIWWEAPMEGSVLSFHKKLRWWAAWTPPKNRGWTQMFTKGKQFLLLIRQPPCYSYIQSSPVKVLAVIEDINIHVHYVILPSNEMAKKNLLQYSLWMMNIYQLLGSITLGILHQDGYIFFTLNRTRIILSSKKYSYPAIPPTHYLNNIIKC